MKTLVGTHSVAKLGGKRLACTTPCTARRLACTQRRCGEVISRNNRITSVQSFVEPQALTNAISTLQLPSLFASNGLPGLSFDLQGPLSVMQSVAVLAAIIAVHETGHFMAARLQKIRVTQFSIGFGPALWQYMGKEVEYSLRLIPLGGYVTFPDNDPNAKIDPDDPDLLKNRTIPERALVISAGVLANIASAYLVLLAQVNLIGQTDAIIMPGVKVPEVLAASAAERAGLKSGDLITKVGNFVVPASTRQVSDVVGLIREAPGVKIALTVVRGEETVELSIVPDVNSDGKGRIGVQMGANRVITHLKPRSASEALSMAAVEMNEIGGRVASGIAAIFANISSVNLSGPVAIVAAGSEAVRVDSSGIFQFAAAININLAMINLLPLPGLDGGYLALLALEAVRGRKLPEVVEQTVMASGLLMLTTLAFVLLIKDTANLF